MFFLAVAGKELLDLLVRIHKLSDRNVVVKRGDVEGDKLGHIDRVEPLTRKELGAHVGEVGAKNSRDGAVGIGLVETTEAVGEDGVGSVAIYVSRVALFECVGNVKHRLT